MHTTFMIEMLKKLYLNSPKDNLQRFTNLFKPKTLKTEKKPWILIPNYKNQAANKKKINSNKTNYSNINFDRIEFHDEQVLFDIEDSLQGKIGDTSFLKSEMSFKDRAFINGIIRKTKPKNVVEIGLSAGGSSCVILNALKDIENSKLYSFDYNTIWYRDANRKQNNGRKTGFLVPEIVPNLISKWELFTGGVPSKYLENIPIDGIDVCLIDTAHFNPGEHLNILEILPFMKKNGIIIFHDTAYHTLRFDTGYTNCIALNTLRGKRIKLNSENTNGLPNIGAIVLDDDIESMLYPLFSNLSLSWSYKISNDDYLEMLNHFNMYYPSDLIKLFVYYCHFYMNDGLKNYELATKIAEDQANKIKT